MARRERTRNHPLGLQNEELLGCQPELGECAVRDTMVKALDRLAPCREK